MGDDERVVSPEPRPAPAPAAARPAAPAAATAAGGTATRLRAAAGAVGYAAGSRMLSPRAAGEEASTAAPTAGAPGAGGTAPAAPPSAEGLVVSVYDTNPQNHSARHCPHCQAAARALRAADPALEEDAALAQAKEAHLAEGGTLADMEEFRSEAERFAADHGGLPPLGVSARDQIVTGVTAQVAEARTARGQPDLRVRILAFFGHGGTNSISIGERIGGERQVRALATGLSPLLSPDVVVANYACSTAGSGTGEGSYADQLHDELVGAGLPGATTMGHLGTGHATARPQQVIFQGGTEGGGAVAMDQAFPPSFVQAEATALGLSERQQRYLRQALDLFWARAMAGDRARDMALMSPGAREALFEQVRGEWQASEGRADLTPEARAARRDRGRRR